jgi:hypothetical protein
MYSRRRGDTHQPTKMYAKPESKHPRLIEEDDWSRRFLGVRLDKLEQKFPEAAILRASLRCSSDRGYWTRIIYARSLVRWWKWCNAHGHDPLQPDPSIVAIWISGLLQNAKWTGPSMALAALRLLFKVQKGIDLYDRSKRRWAGPLHNVVMGALRDPEKNRQARPHRVIDVAKVRTMLSVQLGLIADARDASLLTLGFGGGLPPLVLRRMRFEWVREQDDRLYVYHDAPGYSSPYIVPCGKHDLTCPIRNFRRWSALRLKLAGTHDGFVFTRITRDRCIATDKPLSEQGLNYIVLLRSMAAGLDRGVLASDMRWTAARELGELNLSDTRYLIESNSVSPATAYRHNQAKRDGERRQTAAARRSRMRT